MLPTDVVEKSRALVSMEGKSIILENNGLSENNFLPSPPPSDDSLVEHFSFRFLFIYFFLLLTIRNANMNVDRTIKAIAFR